MKRTTIFIFIIFVIITVLTIGGCETYRKIYRKHKVANLINKLHYSNSTIRSKSAITLARLNSINAVHSLIGTLEDEVIIVRAAAATSLGEIGENIHGSVDELIKLLNDRDSFVKVCAANALGKIGTPDAINAVESYMHELIYQLHNEDKWVLRYALNALGNVGNRAIDAVPKIEILLDSEDQNVRSIAEWAIKQIDNPML